MNKNLLILVSIFTVNALSAQLGEPQSRKQWELERLVDPATGKIPDHVRFRELAFIQANSKVVVDPIAIKGTPWMHRGPFHVGGRTRAAAFDAANNKRIVAGGVSGGLWLSEDGGNSWRSTQEPHEMSSVSCLTQDRRKGYENFWYAGTGEAYGQSAGAPGAYYYGNGLLVSSDSGKSWSPIASTAINTPTAFTSPWQLVWKVLVDTTRYDSTILYASTYQNVMRSNDGGKTWIAVRKTAAYFNEIEIDADGVLYSTSSSDASLGRRGVFRSLNGWEWIDITPTNWQGKAFNRSVVGFNHPQKQDTTVRMYVIVNLENWGKPLPDSRGEIEWGGMFYMELPRRNSDTSFFGGSKSGIIQQRDISENLPLSNYALNSWRTQGSYDMLVQVYPNSLSDKDIVFIGGTNLYRSESGFLDSQNTTMIGGYAWQTSLPNFEMWPNQHPDQHVWMFHPQDPKKVLSGNDGGLFQTDDCLAKSVNWKSLNNGYLTTQWYTVALDPATNMSDLLITGAQDNNQMIVNDRSPQAMWDVAYPGDGSYCAVEPGGKFAYFSKQLGNTVKAELNGDGKVIRKRRIDPIGVPRNNYQFINPFLLDPKNSKVMYMAGGRHIWRNDRLNEVVLDNSTDSISLGWRKSVDSIKVISQKITALAVSTENPSHKIYFGNNVKYLYSIENADTGSMKFKTLKTPSVTGSANVSCIAVNPKNGNELVVCYSNYGVYSLFRSIDGGDNWEKIGGNLEANANGTGDGPSIRWFSFVPVKDGMLYMVGTSVGLYAADTLKGLETEWVHQGPGEIGHAVVDMIAYREIDGTLAVATHGRGIYYARIFEKGAILSARDSEKLPSKSRVFPNPTKDKISISSNFEIRGCRVLDIQAKENLNVKVDPFADKVKDLKIDLSSLKSGVYYLILETSAGVEWHRIVKD
jgi:photosystem II stability/assembly factor-like uncharacterized protein